MITSVCYTIQLNELKTECTLCTLKTKYMYVKLNVHVVVNQQFFCMLSFHDSLKLGTYIPDCPYTF
jgi:hypothetical protein